MVTVVTHEAAVDLARNARKHLKTSAAKPPNEIVIRPTALPSDHGFTFTIERAGELLFTTGNRVDLALRMLALGIENPLHLIDAAESWGVVDIHETAYRE